MSKGYDIEGNLSKLNQTEKIIDFNILHWNELAAKDKWKTLLIVGAMPALWELHKFATWLENKEKK